MVLAPGVAMGCAAAVARATSVASPQQGVCIARPQPHPVPAARRLPAAPAGVPTCVASHATSHELRTGVLVSGAQAARRARSAARADACACAAAADRASPAAPRSHPHPLQAAGVKGHARRSMAEALLDGRRRDHRARTRRASPADVCVRLVAHTHTVCAHALLRACGARGRAARVAAATPGALPRLHAAN